MTRAILLTVAAGVSAVAFGMMLDYPHIVTGAVSLCTFAMSGAAAFAWSRVAIHNAQERR